MTEPTEQVNLISFLAELDRQQRRTAHALAVIAAQLDVMIEAYEAIQQEVRKIWWPPDSTAAEAGDG